MIGTDYILQRCQKVEAQGWRLSEALQNSLVKKIWPKICKKKQICFLVWSCSIWLTLLRNKRFAQFPHAESLGKFSTLLSPSLYSDRCNTEASLALHDQSIKFLSPSQSEVQPWNVMSRLSGGRLPALPCSSNAVVGFTASSEPPECCKDLLSPFA